jgi:hypothetical protein
MPDANLFACAFVSDGSDLLEVTLKTFDRAWRDGPRPALDDFLPAGEEMRRNALVELVHIDLEHCLKAGEPARVEGYLKRYPDLAQESAVVLELIEREMELRQRQEPNLGAQEYLDRFPDYRACLSARLASGGGGTAAAGRSAHVPKLPCPSDDRRGTPSARPDLLLVPDDVAPECHAPAGRAVPGRQI